MATIYPAVLVVLGFSGAAVLLSWGYFRRYAVTRPPIGVFNLTDIAFLIGGIIGVPYLYLLLPLWLVGGLLLLGSLSVVYFLWEPVLGARLRVWAASLFLVGADLASAAWLGPTSNGFRLINNLVLLAMVVGLTNLWAQSGMQARDVTILGGFLLGYDFIATWLLPLMGEMMARLADLPLAPLMAWAVGKPDAWVGIGLGDLLLAAVFPLVMCKAFGRSAGRAALLLALGALAALMLLPLAGIFPVMIVLGPLMILQYRYWSHRQGRERTTWQYRQAEPLGSEGL